MTDKHTGCITSRALCRYCKPDLRDFASRSWTLFPSHLLGSKSAESSLRLVLSIAGCVSSCFVVFTVIKFSKAVFVVITSLAIRHDVAI